MKKYETLDGTPIELDHEGWLDSGGAVISPTALAHLAELGIIRKRKMTFQELLDAFPGLPYRPAALPEDSVLGIVLQRIIDKGLVDQILADD